MKKLMKMFFCAVLAFVLCFAELQTASATGIAFLDSLFSTMKGELQGIGYTVDCFTNFGEKTATFTGDKIAVSPNREYDFWNEEYVMSSVLTITIDGSEIASCGDTLIFYEDGIAPDYDFTVQDIHSDAAGTLVESPFIAQTINDLKNFCGKPMVAVIKSQTGKLLYAFSGNDVRWEVPHDLPKMTSLIVDGKRIYIHRANYQIIDAELLRGE